MPRRGENIYKRKDGRWEGRYIKEYTQSGKAKYGYIYAHSYKDVKLKLNKKLNEKEKIINSTFTEMEEKSFSDWSIKWLQYKKNSVKESTYNHYRNIVKNHICPHFEQYKVENISSDKIEEFANFLLSEGNKKTLSGLSSKTVSDILTIMKEIFKYIKANNIDVRDAFSTIKIKQHKQNMRVLATEEEAKLISTLTSNMNRYKFGILLSLYTGLRIGEVCALQGKHFSTSDKTLSVEQTVQRMQLHDRNKESKTQLTITSPKSNSSFRIIPLPEFLYLFKDFFDIEDECFLLSGTLKIIEPRTMQNYFKKYLRESSVVDANYHALRHTFATRCVEAGFDIKSLSEILGHSSVKITLDKYVHSSMKLKRENMDKLEMPIVIPMDSPSKISS